MKKNMKKMAVWVMLLTITISSVPLPALAYTKNETVYTKLSETGKVKSILVNEQIINTDEIDLLEDESELKDILNINNNATYEMDNNKLVWNTYGKNVFYQGSIDKELPISLNITYKLNGVESKIDDILGKSGHIEIALKYHNSDAHIVLVNGKYETLYTPFVVTMGTILDSSDANISISNGKVISNGTKNIVGGIAAPGLYESLKLEEIKNIDTIIISYDTKSFELPSIYSVVIPKLIENNDLEIFNKMDKLYSSVSTLQSSMNEIDEGAKKVLEGSNKLKDGLYTSIKSMDENTSDALTPEQLTLIKNSTVASVKSTFTDEYKNALANNVWSQVKASMGTGTKVIELGTTAVTNVLVEYLKSADEYNAYLLCEQGKALMTATGSMSAEQMASCGVIQADTTLSILKSSLEKEVTSALTNASLYVAGNVSKQVATSVSEQTALEVAANVSDILAPTIANQVKDASIETIKTSLNTLYNGVSELDQGISSLSEGISKFNSEGITKISNTLNGDIKTTEEKIKAMVKLSEAYNLFASSQNGETKFIMVIDSKKAKTSNTDINNETIKTTLWGRIKNLFAR